MDNCYFYAIRIGIVVAYCFCLFNYYCVNNAAVFEGNYVYVILLKYP